MRSTATFVVEDTKIFHDDTLSLESKNEKHKLEGTRISSKLQGNLPEISLGLTLSQVCLYV